MANYIGNLKDKNSNTLSVLEEKVVFEKSYSYGSVWLDSQTIDIDGANYRFYNIKYTSNYDAIWSTGLTPIGDGSVLLRLATTNEGWYLARRNITVTTSHIVIEDAYYSLYNGKQNVSNGQCCPIEITLYR